MTDLDDDSGSDDNEISSYLHWAVVKIPVRKLGN